MTTLTKPVTRKLPEKIDNRQVTVTLDPNAGDTQVIVRQVGRRTAFKISARTLYYLLGEREARAIIEEKKNARRSA